MRKEPWVAQRAAADHDHVAAGLFEHIGGLLRGGDIAIADDRNGDGLFNLANDVPVGRWGVHLLACAAVNRDGVCPGLGADLCDFNGIELCVVPAFAELDGDRNGHGSFDGGNDVSTQGGGFHQRAAAAVVADFWRGAAHIDVDGLG